MEIQASDLSARLLATENLNVVRARARTASFDIKNRVLTIPVWKDMTPEIEDMLIGHEVGHALYTGEEYLTPIKENKSMMSYLNVLEDVRIEKMIKRKYPGLRKRMNEGYKQLNDRDFFGVKQVQNFDELLLIDKINLYFKAGFQCGVTFDPDEKPFVNRAEKTETIDEIIELAKDIYAYSKAKAEEEKEQAAKQRAEEGDADDDADGDDDFDPDADPDFDDDDRGAGKEKQKGTAPKQDEVKDEDLESKTERSFQDKLEDLADTDTEYFYHKIDDVYPNDPIIPFKRILKETSEKVGLGWYDEFTLNQRPEYVEQQKKIDAEYEKFKADTQRAVNYLVKEFEMRKSAQMYKRAQISKSGSLDMKKIYAYKLQDDLFKRVTVLPQGKNHGMVFLLDWSGSMSGVMEDTLKQVINLAQFCTRAQIPYRVLGFTSQYNERHHDQNYYERHRAHSRARASSTESYLSNATTSMHLLEIFSSKMTTSEFNTMARRVLDFKFFWNKGYSMGGTPLNEALGWVYHNLGDYIKANNIEKMTLITLTDGEGGALASHLNGRLDEAKNMYIGSQYKKIKMKHYIRDDRTQKTYEINRLSAKQTEVMLRMIKDRYDISVVGFYITRNTRRDLAWVINANLPEFNGGVEALIDNWRKDFRAQGFSSVKHTGRDDLFIVPQESTKIEEGELNVNGDANAKAIARNFSKFLNVKKTSRVLLNRFIGYVA
jgi:Mg-chelatase subunit ChlD